MNLSQSVESQFREQFGEKFQDLGFVIAVSGGRDSMVVLHVLTQLLPREKLFVAHFNYQLRGEQSDQDESRVREYCAKNALVFECRRQQIKPASEETMRRARREFFAELCEKYNARAIVTAHHGRDQLETLLFRLLRGTGVQGLGGMRPYHEGYFRPLLKLSSDQLENYAKANEVEFGLDASNESARYCRNRIRQTVVAPIENMADEFGGASSFYQRLSQTLSQLHDTHAYVELKAREIYSKLFIETPLWVVCDLNALRELDSFLRRQTLRVLRQRLDGGYWQYQDLSRLVSAIENGGKGLSLEGGISMTSSCGKLFFQKERSPFTARVVQVSDKTYRYEPADVEISLDSGFSDEVQCRFFSDGDRYHSKKLKHLLLEQRIPSPERALIPIVARRDSHEVLWFFPLQSPKVDVKLGKFPFSFLPSV